MTGSMEWPLRTSRTDLSGLLGKDARSGGTRSTACALPPRELDRPGVASWLSEVLRARAPTVHEVAHRAARLLPCCSSVGVFSSRPLSGDVEDPATGAHSRPTDGLLANHDLYSLCSEEAACGPSSFSFFTQGRGEAPGRAPTEWGSYAPTATPRGRAAHQDLRVPTDTPRSSAMRRYSPATCRSIARRRSPTECRGRVDTMSRGSRSGRSWYRRSAQDRSGSGSLSRPAGRSGKPRLWCAEHATPRWAMRAKARPGARPWSPATEDASRSTPRPWHACPRAAGKPRRSVASTEGNSRSSIYRET